MKQISQRVDARLERQRILDLAKPPMFWVVVDEGVLRRPVGGAGKFREQLGHLAKFARHPGVVLQVMPFAAGGHAGLLGEFTLLGLAGGPRHRLHRVSRERPADRPGPTRSPPLTWAFDMIRAVALSPDASLDFVARLEGDISHGLMAQEQL